MNSEPTQLLESRLHTESPYQAGLASWCFSRGKRTFDVLFAGSLFCAALPLVTAVSLALRLISPNPVFFRQVRQGRDGRAFELIKFRTMKSSHVGPAVTSATDLRVTRFGRFLRRWKIDELPQLVNVIRGDMSMVGPRPDLRQFLADIDPELASILKLRPGITSVATLQFRHEEQLLAQVPVTDVERFYREELLPRKLKIDLEYARSANFFSDIGILLKTPFGILL